MLVWGVIAIGGGAAASNLRGAADSFHELIPEYRRWPRSVAGLRKAAAAWTVLCAIFVGMWFMG
ncbi:hypothetical protein [Streptomyces wuyuanensis]|uniref:Uncharacterized protein n=1 Tax=Streptomyces wuyuanensis TaxID=1196353 RepID=A0A1G9S5G9_9ACTN|nr:hypothetical protein [Streptomyces wuyuanensis]SDM29995.1 hypothetical protein SAMN05444921_106152 [Streptomyces wuyuanensis]